MELSNNSIHFKSKASNLYLRLFCCTGIGIQVIFVVSLNFSFSLEF